jgi:formate dehydrogenase subunit gamma
MTLAIDIDSVRRIAAAHQDVPGGLLPALHAVQDALGHIPPESVAVIADVFNLSRAEVHGTISYYHHFRSQPAGRCVVQVCRAEACQAMGGQALMAHAEQRLGCAQHATSPDGAFTLEPVFCLGLCASAPAAMIGQAVHGRLTPQKFDRLAAEAGRAA